MTTRLYQEDVYTNTWNALITSVAPSPAKAGRPAFAITLDQSAFFPEGGGQSCDLGMLGPYEIVDVQEEGGEVIHTVCLPDGMDGSGATGPVAEPPAEGMSVHCVLDWDRRFDNMQRHCGEHILSGIFHARCGGVNRGFHMGEDYMTIDISLENDPADPDTPRPASIDMALALECEMRANKVIWSNQPVAVFRFEERAEAEKMPLRKALAFDEDISIVCIGSPEKPADCVACCGTHPSTSAQVGLVKILKVENYKNMFRIYFEAGQRAMKYFDLEHEILTDLSNRYSSSIEDFPEKIKAQEQKLAETKDQLYHIKKALIDKECAQLDAALEAAQDNAAPAASAAPDTPAASVAPDTPVTSVAPDTPVASAAATTATGSPLLVWPLDNLSLDDAFEMAKRYMKTAPRLILLYAKQNTSFILVSNGQPHCGKLVKEYASFYQGKGGGNDVSARAIFSTEENAMLFADLLEKHLR